MEYPASPSPSQPSRPPSSARKWLLLVPAALLLAAAAAFFLMRETGVDKALVKEQVDVTLKRIALAAQQQGVKAEVTYRDIEIGEEGGALHIALLDPRMEMSEMNARQGGAQVTLSSKRLVFEPESLDFQEYRVALPEPLSIVTDSGAGFQAAFDGTPEYSVRHDAENVSVALKLPPKITFTPNEQGSKPVTVSYDDGAVLTGLMDKQYRWKESAARFTNISIEAMADASLTIKSLDSRVLIDPAADAPPLQDISYVLTVEDFLFPMNPYGAVDIALDAKLRVNPAVFNHPEELSAIPQFRLAANNIAVNTDQFGLSLKGDLSGVEGDPLPVGQGEMTVRGFDRVLGEMEKNGLLGESAKEQLTISVKKATGKELQGMTDLTLALSRAPGGELRIGETTLGDLMPAPEDMTQPQPALPAPQAPIPDRQ